MIFMYIVHENQWVGWNLCLEKNKMARSFIREARVIKNVLLYSDKPERIPNRTIQFLVPNIFYVLF